MLRNALIIKMRFSVLGGFAPEFLSGLFTQILGGHAPVRAHQRLDHCPKSNGKSSCRKCEIHCYSPANREKIRSVMKYVGPRMIFIHPWSAIRHLITEFC